MDPISLAVAKTALNIAADAARNYNKKAAEAKNDLLSRCENYLAAAVEAIKGLEAEYEGLLTQARYCNLKDAGQVQSLQIRLRDYLKVDKLRPELHDAIIGLGKCREELKTWAETRWQRSATKAQREKKLADLDQLLEKLGKYLKNLDECGLQFRKAGTGVGLKWLLQVKEVLDSKFDMTESRLIGIVAEADKDQTKDKLKDYTEPIRNTIHDIRRAFQ